MTSRSVLTQRDLLTTFKWLTYKNVSILSKIYPLSNELSKQIFKEDALEKPTQHIFIHLSYYLVLIIDAQKAATFTWPLYDSKLEKTYRNELSTFIAGYASSGALAPVLSSYFVNPGCFKVTKLMFQLSQLALQRASQDRLQSDSQKTLYNDAAAKYKAGSKDFLEYIEKETVAMRRKFQNYQQKKQVMIKASEMLKKKILENEDKLAMIKKQKFLPDLVEGFIRKHSVGDAQREELEKIKNIKEPVKFFVEWLHHIDDQITEMESDWDGKVTPLLEMSRYCQETSQALILRHTGEMDKNTYMVEYDPKTDDIATKDLESHVNPSQKYILKNVITDGKLNFPNLVRGFVISICFLLKNKDIDNDIYQISECLEVQRRNFGEMVSALKVLLERIMDAETQLQLSPVSICDQTISVISEVPPLPDLSDLKATQTLQYNGIFDSFTPLNLSKHQFNLRRKASEPKFAKPQPRSLTTPFQTSRDDFLKGFNSFRVNLNERPKLNLSQNISIISQGADRGNETIAECSSGFTKQQIQRLLSTKKNSSSKKSKFNPERPQSVIKKGCLFNESSESSGILFRSHSSPNLFENKEKRPACKRHGRKLPILQEDSSFLLEVSGIVALDSASNSGCGTPIEVANISRSQLLTDAISLPSITISPMESVHHKFTHNFKEKKNEHAENLFNDLNGEYIDKRTQLEKPKEEKGANKLLESLIPKKINPVRSLQKCNQILKETEDLNQVFILPNIKENATPKSIDSLADKEVLLFMQPHVQENTTRKSTDSLKGKEEHSFVPSHVKENIKHKSTDGLTGKEHSFVPSRVKENITEKSTDSLKGKEEHSFVPSHVKESITRKSTDSLTGQEENCFVPSHVKENVTQKSTGSLTGKEENSVTPKSNIPVRKSSSIEKIINRFKKVRASVVSESRDDTESIFKTILEEKFQNIDFLTANRMLLPDLVSPSCSVLSQKQTDFVDTFGFDIDDEEPCRKPRESLGALLGVDQNFLDQFNLID